MNLMPPYAPKTWKAIGISVTLLVLVGVVLFLAQECGTYRAHRDLKKLRANVNASLQEVKNAQANVTNDNVAVAVAVEHVKEATKELVEASNAVDATKIATNQATANFANSVNANRPTGTTESDLQKQLDQLGVQ